MKAKPIKKKPATVKSAKKSKAAPKPGKLSAIAKSSLTVTKAAAAKLKEIAKQAKMEGKFIRVFAANGCCGMQYGMDFDDKTDKNDVIIEEAGLKVVVEKSMVDLLNQAKIDYVKTEHSEGFRIDNPNEKGSCGDDCHGSCNC